MPALATSTLIVAAGAALAIDYPAPKPLKEGAQADASKLAKPEKIVIAYMPPATEFNYYIAIGEGIKAAAAAKPASKSSCLRRNRAPTSTARWA